MLTTVEGVYENGKVILKESPPVKTASKVLVTFMTEDKPTSSVRKRKLGTMSGTIKMADDFNDDMSDLDEYI
ncbi:hypothetical protein [Dyadobacter sp. 676]|uniref:DUF2281 domain-containing protein n=1 Tax=Dyadobacter sp. 676 TaxID=3088362 RepID=A0AAU8FE66_9BACT